jgi:hypothetical protein
MRRAFRTRSEPVRRKISSSGWGHETIQRATEDVEDVVESKTPRLTARALALARDICGAAGAWVRSHSEGWKGGAASSRGPDRGGTRGGRECESG